MLAGGLWGACAPATQDARLRLDAPVEDGDADVYVDGSYVGQISALEANEASRIRLAPGVHRVEIRKAGRFPVQRTVRVDGDVAAEVTVRVDLLSDPL